MKKSKKRKEEEKREYLLYLEFKARELYYEAERAMGRRKDRAIELLQRAIKINPEFLESYILLGYLYNSKKEYKEALRFLLRAKGINPERREVHYHLGHTYTHLNMPEKALNSYESLISLLKKKKLSEDEKKIKEEVEKRILVLKFTLKEEKEKTEVAKFLPQKEEKKLEEVEKSKISLEDLLSKLKISKSFNFRKDSLLIEKLKREDYDPFRLYKVKTWGSELSAFFVFSQ